MRLSRSDVMVIDNLRMADDCGPGLPNMLRSHQRGAKSHSVCMCPNRSWDRPDGIGPEHEALLADSVGLALLVVLETLTPAERLAFVLHDMFAVPFDQIAPIVNRSPDRRVKGQSQ